MRFRTLLGDLGATHDVHFKLVVKRVVAFLLVLIVLFARCYRWGATSEYPLKIGDFDPTKAVWPKISGRRGRFPPIILLLGKARLSDLSYGVKIGQIFLSFCHNARVWQADGQTDSFIIARPRCLQCMQCMQRGNHKETVADCLQVKCNFRRKKWFHPTGPDPRVDSTGVHFGSKNITINPILLKTNVWPIFLLQSVWV